MPCISAFHSCGLAVVDRSVNRTHCSVRCSQDPTYVDNRPFGGLLSGIDCGDQRGEGVRFCTRTIASVCSSNLLLTSQKLVLAGAGVWIGDYDYRALCMVSSDPWTRPWLSADRKPSARPVPSDRAHRPDAR